MLDNGTSFSSSFSLPLSSFPLSGNFSYEFRRKIDDQRGNLCSGPCTRRKEIRERRPWSNQPSSNPFWSLLTPRLMSLYRIVEQRERARAREEERERERKRTDPFLFRSGRKFIVSSGIISEIPIFHLYQRCCPGKQKKKGMRFLISRILNVLIVHPTFIVHIYIYIYIRPIRTIVRSSSLEVPIIILWQLTRAGEIDLTAWFRPILHLNALQTEYQNG